jgi:hypothetical protein
MKRRKREGRAKGQSLALGGAETAMSGEDGRVEEGEEGMDEACKCKV